jgi:hypothetical protein
MGSVIDRRCTSALVLRAGLLGGLVRAGILGIMLAAGAVGVGSIALATVPEPEPVARRWELDFKPGPFRIAAVEIEGQPAKAYLYMTYRVANNSKEDVLYAPVFELATGEGALVRSGVDIAPEVTKVIAAKLDNPLLRDQIAILGTLQQGDANAREGIVVWNVPAADIDKAIVYVSGLSGETQTVEVIDPATKELKRVSLRKTRMLTYRMPGDILKQGNTPFDQAEDRWIMR